MKFSLAHHQDLSYESFGDLFLCFFFSMLRLPSLLLLQLKFDGIQSRNRLLVLFFFRFYLIPPKHGEFFECCSGRESIRSKISNTEKLEQTRQRQREIEQNGETVEEISRLIVMMNHLRNNKIFSADELCNRFCVLSCCVDYISLFCYHIITLVVTCRLLIEFVRRLMKGKLNKPSEDLLNSLHICRSKYLPFISSRLASEMFPCEIT